MDYGSYKHVHIPLVQFCLPGFPPHNHYRPQRSCEGYVFTCVCKSFCSQREGCLGPIPRGNVRGLVRGVSALGCLPGSVSAQKGCLPGDVSGQTPPGRHHPRQQTTTAAAGTHPTGMHSRFPVKFHLKSVNISDFRINSS